MKVFYIGASVRQGRSAKDNTPYTIGEIAFAVPDKSSSKSDPDGSPRWNYTAHGHRVQTMQLDPSKLSAFASVKPCSEVNLLVEPIPENPSRNQVVGVA